MTENSRQIVAGITSYGPNECVDEKFLDIDSPEYGLNLNFCFNFNSLYEKSLTKNSEL